MTHGPEYKTNGKRPVWLKDGDAVKVRWSDGTTGYRMVKDITHHWENIQAIYPHSTHWANAAIEAGLEPWAGGDEAPEDWDGQHVLLRNGNEKGHGVIWSHYGGGSDIIGYKKKESVVSEEVQDWAIKEALKEVGYLDTVSSVRVDPEAYKEILIIARMIQTYEPHRKPKDRDEEIAEKWVEKWYENDDLPIEQAILSAIKEAKS